MAFRRRHTSYLLVALALIASACARRSLAPVVPAQAPESISDALWDSLTAPANLITDAPHLHGTWARNVMFISFKTTATQAERQAAIALIHGEIVGGRAMPMGEPQYIVRIPYALPGDSLSGPVLRAFKTLMDHPAVVAAYPLGMTNFNVLHGIGAASAFDVRHNTPTVPAHAPDSISSVLWDSLTAPANLMTDPPGMRDRWARNVMFITFTRTATQAERQAVIDLIHGEVLGGNVWPGGEGEYIVRISYATARGDSVSGPVLRTFVALHGHPSILTAYPLSMDNLSRFHDITQKSRAGAPPSSGPAPILPPDTVPHALFDSLGIVMAAIPGIEPGPYRRDIVVVRFEPETPLAVRTALLDSISGQVVGGEVDADRQSGIYFVRISGGTFDALVGAVTIMQRQPQVAYASWWGLFIPDIQSYRRPDGARRRPHGERTASPTLGAPPAHSSRRSPRM